MALLSRELNMLQGLLVVCSSGVWSSPNFRLPAQTVPYEPSTFRNHLRAVKCSASRFARLGGVHQEKQMRRSFTNGSTQVGDMGYCKSSDMLSCSLGTKYGLVRRLSVSGRAGEIRCSSMELNAPTTKSPPQFSVWLIL